jgi:predicted DNA-binding transcriptional regulator AlpA
LAQGAVDQVLTTKALAERLGLSIYTLIGWRRQGKGPKAVRLTPSLTVYDLDEVERWERETGRQPA